MIQWSLLGATSTTLPGEKTFLISHCLLAAESEEKNPEIHDRYTSPKPKACN